MVSPRVTVVAFVVGNLSVPSVRAFMALVLAHARVSCGMRTRSGISASSFSAQRRKKGARTSSTPWPSARGVVLR